MEELERAPLGARPRGHRGQVIRARADHRDGHLHPRVHQHLLHGRREHRDEIDPSPGPEAWLCRGELLELLGALLERLPPEQQSVLMLHEFEEMSLSEIAMMLDIPPGTAASRLRRARHAFGQLISEYREAYELEAI